MSDWDLKDRIKQLIDELEDDMGNAATAKYKVGEGTILYNDYDSTERRDKITIGILRVLLEEFE